MLEVLRGLSSAGHFWWRGLLCGRKTACDLGLSSCLIRFPVYNALLAAKAAILLCIMWMRGKPSSVT